eukprot:TRINITY_DN61051_c0_g1_i2.p1 TRINITY_DN61051_c0_g1~~TRINITY_DN61051_c0_g1_i2.p1  ORF type:complete len:233 (+),score=122.34 TRINITY_DN61051_c0_g1_i2:498-1196(+)
MSVGFLLSSREDAIIWRGPRKNGLITQFLTDTTWSDELDYLIIDTPPGTSDEHISMAQLLKKSNVDGAVIVTTPQEVALLDVRKEISFCRKVGIKVLGVVENMAYFQCPCCDHKAKIFAPTTGGAATMAQKMGVPFLGSIPLDPAMLLACERGQSCWKQQDDDSAEVDGDKQQQQQQQDIPSAPAFAAVVENLLKAVGDVDDSTDTTMTATTTTSTSASAATTPAAAEGTNE